MGTWARTEEVKVAEAYRLFNENPSWRWKALSEATGIKNTTLRHLFYRRWGITMRNRSPKLETGMPSIPQSAENSSQKTELSIADIIIEQNTEIKRLRIELDKRNSKLKDISQEREKLRVAIIEAQSLLAHRD